MSLQQRLFSLKGTILISFLVKLLIFLIGVAIIGLDTSRTSLPACGVSSGTLPPTFVAPLGDLEGYTDFRDLYLRCLVTPFLHGQYAYTLPIVYNYPPLFLYALSLFGKVNVAWFPAIPIVAFDALTAIPVYLIAKEFIFKRNSQKLAFAVTLAFIANPINLFYDDLMWLNPGPATFFLVLSVYLFLKDKFLFSSIALAVSTGFKQTSVLVFPILIIAMWKIRGFSREILYLIGAYFGLLVIISLPYIYANPQQYFWSLQLPILGNPPGTSPSYQTTFQYDLGQPVRITTFLGLIRIVNLQSATVYSYQILNYVFIACYVALALYFLTTKERPSAQDILVYLLAAFLLFDALFGRGIYKYYFAGITPFALVFFTMRRNAIIFSAFSIALLFIPRIVDPWMAVLLLTLLPSLMIRKEESGIDRLNTTVSG